MPLGAIFKALLAFPATAQPGSILFRKRPDGELDMAVSGLDSNLVFMRRPHLQMTFTAKGSLIPAGGIFGKYLTVEDLELDALLSGAVSDTPAAADAEITVTRGVDLVARFTVPAGQSQFTPEIIMPAVPKGNLLIIRAPLVQDATLSGVTGTLGARRI